MVLLLPASFGFTDMLDGIKVTGASGKSIKMSITPRIPRQHLASSCTFPWVPESADTTHGWLLWLSSTLLGIQTSARVPIATWDVMF